MATNLLIAFPDLPKSTVLTTSVAAATGYPATNLPSGPRGAHFQFGSAATDSWVKAPQAGTRRCDYFIVARADLLKKQGATGLLLKRSSDDVTYANHLGNVSDFQSATFYGKRSEDYISTPSVNNSAVNWSTSAFQYWRLHTSKGSALAYTYSKWYAGEFLDLGRDPIAPYETLTEIDSGKGRDPRHVISLTWRGIANATVETFLALLARGDTEPLFLYTASYHDLLHGLRLLHVRPRSWGRQLGRFGTSEISVIFEELV